MKSKLGIILLAALLIIPCFAAAQQGSIKLLALVEQNDSTIGTIADLILEIRPGNGRVFLETFPLTKITTQISMRFAKQIACKELDIDCSSYDFIYTIKARPGIVGGPSAGAAAAVLTAALLKNYALNSSIAITGTINSGGIIGTVGGLNEKISAASLAGIKKVLIPRGSMLKSPEGNNTPNTTAANRSIDIAEVATLDEALYSFAGINVSSAEPELDIDDAYRKTMKSIGTDICNRCKALYREVEQLHPEENATLELMGQALNYTMQGDRLFADEAYYSAASFCFRANTNYRTVHNQMTLKAWQEKKKELKGQINGLENETDSMELKTITDLQTYMLVRERLTDAAGILEQTAEQNKTEKILAELAYVEERIYSARLWSSFFGMPGKVFRINQASLLAGCENKLTEAEERYSYIKTIIPYGFESIGKELGRAYAEFEKGNYKMCFFGASVVKADADVILTLVGVEDSALNSTISIKLNRAKRAIVKAQEGRIFPIVGYSYYEYATSLKDNDLPSALQFAEYALELSYSDIYFEKEQQPGSAGNVPNEYYKSIVITVFFIAVTIYLIIQAIMFLTKRKAREIGKKRKYQQ